MLVMLTCGVFCHTYSYLLFPWPLGRSEHRGLVLIYFYSICHDERAIISIVFCVWTRSEDTTYCFSKAGRHVGT